MDGLELLYVRRGVVGCWTGSGEISGSALREAASKQAAQFDIQPCRMWVVGPDGGMFGDVWLVFAAKPNFAVSGL